MNKIEPWQLTQRQSLPLEQKIILTLNRAEKFFEECNGSCYLSFSGGKDSTVMLHLLRQVYPKIPFYFCNTRTEFPEIVKFVKTFEGVNIIYPDMLFKDVIEKHGYPLVSKEVSEQIEELRTTKNPNRIKYHLEGYIGRNGKVLGRMSFKWRYLIDSPIKISKKCCDEIKKKPFRKIEKQFKGKIVGIMAEDSRLRKQNILQNTCIHTSSKNIVTFNPLAYWTESDIWEYIKKFNVPYCEIYDMGHTRTGCYPCLFGYSQDPTRFWNMKKTHPKLFDYCWNKLNYKEIIPLIEQAENLKWRIKYNRCEEYEAELGTVD